MSVPRITYDALLQVRAGTGLEEYRDTLGDGTAVVKLRVTSDAPVMLDDERHGALGYSIDGSEDVDTRHHSLATESTSGFIGPGDKIKLNLFTGHTAPTVIGTFGITPATEVGTYGAGPIWVESTGVLKLAGRRGVVEGVGIELYDGAHVIATDGGSVTLPDGTGVAPHPFQRGEGWEAVVDASDSASSCTIICPSGHIIGSGATNANYVVAVGDVVTIRPAGAGQSKWAVQSWTL